MIESISNLARQLSKLPGIGIKTATRLAYFIVDMPKEHVDEMAAALVDAKDKIKKCARCGAYCQNELCSICLDPNRTSRLLCVVKDAKDVISFERTREFVGRYHVLGGVISPMEGIGPNDLRIKELIERIEKEGVKEIVMATNPDVEGEATAIYIAKLLKPFGAKISRIAHGIPIGGNLEYTDEVTLLKAFEGRREM